MEESLIVPGKSPTRKKSGPFGSRRSSAIGIENIQEVQEKRESPPAGQKTPDSGHVSQEPKSENSSTQSSPEMPTTKNSASSFASVVEETEGVDADDTGLVRGPGNVGALQWPGGGLFGPRRCCRQKHELGCD